MILLPAAQGFALGLSLILAIGSQNAFVLRQGLMRQHVLPLVLFCGLSDAILIGAGVLGFGTLAEAAPLFPVIMLWFGVAFLPFYGLNRLQAAWRGSNGLAAGQTRSSLREVLLLAAAFTWLNPHVYLDTLALMGANSLAYSTGQEKFTFFLGGASASMLFFAVLGFGATFLAPIFASAQAWRILDLIIALTMFGIALKLALSAFSS